jgi:phospholipid/cholesterol/gamma-HCH transport system permease protein
VGQAATEAFVFSFIAILFLDFVIGIAWNGVYYALWPSTQTLL